MYTVNFEEITLKQAAQDLKDNRIIYYTYKQASKKTLWTVTEDSISRLILKFILDEDEVLFLRATSYVEEKRNQEQLNKEEKIRLHKEKMTPETERAMILAGGSVKSKHYIDAQEICREVRGK